MSEAIAIPTVTELRRVIDERQRASTQMILLSQKTSLVEGSMQEAIAKGGTLGELAANFVSARKALNAALTEQYASARANAAELTNAYLTDLFGTQVPGEVTLLSAENHRYIRERVIGLESISMSDAGVVSGLVKTEGDTRWFRVIDGEPYFEEHLDF